MDNKVFAVSIAATKIEGNFTEIHEVSPTLINTVTEVNQGSSMGMTMKHAPIVIVAPTLDEALSQAADIAREQWSEAEGYFGHHAIAHEFTRESVEEMLGEL
jgi:hypothetical protein